MVAADAITIAPAGAPSSDAFTWTPAIPSSGIYQVYARWPASSANTGAAQYTVTHGGTANVTLNQKQNGGSWVPLGSWSFAPGAGHKVTLAAAAEGTTIADAMLFVAAGAQPANLLYVHADHLGSPQKMTDASQATVWDGVFDPFSKSSLTPKLRTAHEADAAARSRAPTMRGRGGYLVHCHRNSS